MKPSGRAVAWNTSTAVPSPCINVCQIHPVERLCQGCLRTLDEIAAWGTLDDTARRAVWALINARRQGMPAERDAAP